MKKYAFTKGSASTLLILLLFVINSCQKESEELRFGGDFGIKVNILGLESNSVQNGKVAQKSSSAARQGQVVSGINAQQVVIPFGDDLMLKATLKPDVDVDAVMANYKRETAQGTGNKAAAQRAAAVSGELGDNIAYRVMAYDSEGSLAASRTYQYKGLNLEEDDLNTGYESLIIGETYTFVVYSVNTTTTGDLAAAISDEGSLSTAAIGADSTKDLLFFKEDVEIKHGVNYLNVRLKHQFSQVTTVIKADDESANELIGSRIYGINQASVSPSHSSGSLKFSDGSLTVGEEMTNGSEIVFPSIGAEGVISLTSNPVRVISDGADAIFNIGTLTINQIVNSVNLTHFGTGANRQPFQIQPGVRYTLQLEVAAPCTETVLLDEPDIDVESETIGVDTTYIISNADYGVELDIYELDNSFNIRVNGQPLYVGYTTDVNGGDRFSTNEVQFQGYAVGAHPDFYPNIEFADGERWEIEHEDIWEFDGTAGRRPVVRVITSRNGIAIFASKNENGGEPFYPLRLLNGEQVTTSHGTRVVYGRFNDQVEWNEAPGATNTIEIRQEPIGPTVFRAYIKGTRKVWCNPSLDQ